MFIAIFRYCLQPYSNKVSL